MLNNHWGKDGFVFWHGVVEDRFDPLQVGRYKVRIHGFHEEDKLLQPTFDLPWAYPIIPSNFTGRMNTVGYREGARVCGFFLDGPHGQQPIIFGLIGGWPELPANPELGFNDPRPDSLLFGHQVPREPEELVQHDDGTGNDIFEQEYHTRFPEEHFLPEPDTTRYARGYDGGFIDKTVVPWKIENVEIGQLDVPTGLHPAGTGTDVESPETYWTEEETHYNAQYPYNEVFFSEGGHIFEFDNTPFFERIHLYHRTGSFWEYNEVGLKVDKIVDKHYDIVLRSRHTHIEAFHEHTVDWYAKEYINKDAQAGFNKDTTVGPGGNYNITTEDGKLNIYLNGDWNVYVNGTAYIETEIDLIATVHGNAHVTVDLDLYATVHGNANIHVDGDTNAQIDGDLNCMVGGDWTGRVSGDKTQFIGGDYRLIVQGNCETYAFGDIKEFSAGNIEEVALQNILSMATLTISDTAPVIFHNAAVTNCSALLTGFTTDSDSDTTLPGPVGPLPSFTPDEIEGLMGDAADAVVTELQAEATAIAITLANATAAAAAAAAAAAEAAAVAANPNAPGNAVAES